MTTAEAQALWNRIQVLPPEEKEFISWCAFGFAFGCLQAHGGSEADVFFAELQKLLHEAELRAQNETRFVR